MMSVPIEKKIILKGRFPSNSTCFLAIIRLFSSGNMYVYRFNLNETCSFSTIRVPFQQYLFPFINAYSFQKSQRQLPTKDVLFHQCLFPFIFYYLKNTYIFTFQQCSFLSKESITCFRQLFLQQYVIPFNNTSPSAMYAPFKKVIVTSKQYLFPGPKCKRECSTPDHTTDQNI